jgi:pimeloyl-ACP methyl ester carboxylesterase
MPRVRVNGIDLYFEEHGEGDPLLLIMGWGGNAYTWNPQLPGLAQRYRVIVFDNRGAGRSSAPEEPYTIAQMAEDALALLDALDIASAPVFGISMGGMIAQEVALKRPDRVEALILGCTTPGGKRAAGARELLKDIQTFQGTVGEDGPDLEWFSEFLKRLWTHRALARSDRNLQDFILSMIRYPPPTHGLRNQATAIAQHDAYDRLTEIRQETLVMTGDKDGLIDYENSFILAGRIPNADLRIFRGLKHAFHLEQPGVVNEEIIAFLQRVRLRRAGGPAGAPSD